jgi:hypothetical protein
MGRVFITLYVPRPKHVNLCWNLASVKQATDAKFLSIWKELILRWELKPNLLSPVYGPAAHRGRSA